MGWKGSLRSFNAAVKRQERYQRQLEKQRAVENASEVVEKYNEYLNQIVAFHKVASEPINWNIPKNAPEPLEPIYSKNRELVAFGKHANYVPNFFIRFLRLVEWRKRKLFERIEISKNKDDAEYKKNLSEFRDNHSIWRKDKEFAERMLSGDVDAYAEVINLQRPLHNIKHFSGNVSFSFKSDFVEIDIEIDGDDVLPTEIVTQLKSGKLSVKDMPKAQFNLLYQDHICSIALRVAREALAFIPVELILVNVTTQLLDSVTGHLDSKPILSAKIPRQTVEKLNFYSIDPSDALKNFVHNMNFKKTDGFAAVSKVG